MGRRIKFNNGSISIRIGILIGSIVMAVLVLAIVIIVFFNSIKVHIESISRSDIPSAVLSIQMIDEIDDINSNVLEYILGETEEIEDFKTNRAEFVVFLEEIKKSQSFSSDRIGTIEELFNEYTLGLSVGAFDLYSPDREAWAISRVEAITRYTGTKLENLLDELKNSEIDDVGKSPSISGLIYDDLPGVRYYLELVDEAGDIIANLNDYVRGVPEAREYFMENVQSFEEFLALLKPLETSVEDIDNMKQIDAYFAVLRDGGFEVFEGYNPAKKIEAIKNIDFLEHNTLSELERLLDKMSIEANRNAFDSLEEIKNENSITIYVLVVLVSLVVCLSVFIFFFFNNTVSKPIVKMSSVMDELAKGNLEVELKRNNWTGEIKVMSNTLEVFRDNIKERERIEKALGEEKERAESANRSKSEFLSNMSHEIRTPMNAILGFTQLLKNKVEDPQNLSYLNSIHSSGNALLTLINDILDLSKIESGKFELQQHDVSLRKLLEEIHSFFSEDAKQKGLDFKLEIDESIPDIVLIDESRLRQIVINIVGNALKFTKDGFVSISIKAKDRGSDYVDLYMEIEDSGIGIPLEAQERIFSAFTQKEGQLNSQFGGTGLGLAIALRLIQMMKGKIELQSSEGEGSTFILYIPDIKILKFKSAESYISMETKDKREFSGETILIADDVEENRILLEAMLNTYNLQFVEAKNGNEVIQLCKKSKPDLILLDMKMPLLNGYETAEIMNRDSELSSIPKIAVTASAMVKDRDVISKICDGYISKPIDKKMLLDQMFRLLPKDLRRSKHDIDLSSIEAKMLQKWKKRSKQLLMVKDVEEIELFVKQIMVEANRLKDTSLIHWSKELYDECLNIDIKAIKEYLDMIIKY